MDNTAAITASCEPVLHLHRDIHQSELNSVCYPMCPALSLSQSVRSFTGVLQITFIRMTNGAPAPCTSSSSAAKQQQEAEPEKAVPVLPIRNAHPLAPPVWDGESGPPQMGSFSCWLSPWGQHLWVFARALINNNPSFSGSYREFLFSKTRSVPFCHSFRS